MGAPRIHGELLKLGIDIGETSVGKYMVRQRKPPSQTWRTFLENHVKTMVSIDFFTVPTIRFQVLYVFLVLAHDRRRILHFNVTAHPTAERTAQQLREAFPFDQAPKYLLRDRDGIFGRAFRKDVRWGSRRCFRLPARHGSGLSWNASSARFVAMPRSRHRFQRASPVPAPESFLAYYHASRTHLSLAKDAPEPRPVQPLMFRPIFAIPQVAGLHHRYERRAA